ncbi:hypothetical protein ABE322_21345 [Priestia megaterium]
MKEQVRRTLAQKNGCEYCKATGKPNPDVFDEKTSLALGFAEVFLKQRGEINKSFFHGLKETLKDLEISELCAFISFTIPWSHVIFEANYGLTISFGR